MEDIKITNKNRPSNDIVFGLVFEDIQLFKVMARCVLGEEIDESSYVVSQKENSMGSAIYNKIRFDIYAEGSKIITADMQNGYPGEPIRNRLVYYACRAVGGQRVRRSRYDKLKTCIISFIFENASYDNNRFITKYFMASDDGGKLRKYSDLLTIVEVNLKYHKRTANEELNILCKFLKIQNNRDLDKFLEKYKDTEFGAALYERYMKVIMDKDTMERVEQMDLYQEKMELRYHSVDEALILQVKNSEKIARKLIKRGTPLEIIAEATELPLEKVQQMAKRYNKDK